MLDADPNLQALQFAEDDNTEVLCLEDTTATSASFTKAPGVIKF